MPYKIHNRRYTGSKFKLKDWILSLILQNCKGTTFCDIFAGTGIITAHMLENFQKAIVNDLLFSNNVIYQAFFGREEFDIIKLEKYKNVFNKIDGNKSNYFYENFGGKFYSETDAIRIGAIREKIEIDKSMLRKKEYNILLASLLYSMDKAAHTVGHYDAYIKKSKPANCFVFDLIEPIHANCDIEIFREDANVLAKRIKADIVYVDPPYNSRQYSRFYHVLENTVEWKMPKLYGEALKPAPENMSDYCKVNAPDMFAKLIEDLDCGYIVISYNNTYNSKSNSSKNKIGLDFIRNALEKRGKVKEFSKEHQFFNAGKTDFASHKEYIFIVEGYKK